jgi:protein TonB
MPTQVTIADRLGSTLFLTALAHGVVILGVTFTAGSLDEADVLPSLNVTLIVDSHDPQPAPEQSDLLAQRNQRAAGRVAEGMRPTTTLSADHPMTHAGDPQAADLEDATPRDQAPSAEQLVARDRTDSNLRALPQPAETPAPVPLKAAALLDQTAPQSVATEVDVRAELPSSTDRELIATPSTRESGLATYLDAWRRRVERIGTANFPARLLDQRGDTRPTLEVVIGADGRLKDIVVRRSSGNAALDQAALTILRLAAPFEPLPDKIRAEYDALRFAYEWDFLSGRRASHPATDELAAVERN